MVRIHCCKPHIAAKIMDLCLIILSKCCYRRFKAMMTTIITDTAQLLPRDNYQCKVIVKNNDVISSDCE